MTELELWGELQLIGRLNEVDLGGGSGLRGTCTVQTLTKWLYQVRSLAVSKYILRQG
jgi:hypothetical protein